MSAPDVVEIVPTPAPARPRRTGAVAALVLALVVLAGGVTWAATRGGGSDAAGGGGLTCPASVLNGSDAGNTGTAPAAVPAPPTASGVDGRLVPDGAPTSVLLCEYGQAAVTGVAVGPAEPAATDVGTATAVPNTSVTDAVPSAVPEVTGVAPDSIPTVAPVDLPLAQSVEHPGSDATVTALVTALQGATVRSGDDAAYTSCLVHSDAAVSHYLVGLAYDDGVVWVGGPDLCSGSTNGETGSDLDISGPVLAVLAGGNGSTGDEPVSVDPVPPGGPEPSTSPEPGGADDPGTGSTADPGTGAAADPGSAGATDPSGDLDPDGDVLSTCTVGDTTFATTGAPLVPFTPTAVRVCHLPVQGAASAEDQPADVAVALADAVNGLPALGPDVACTAIGGDTWVLLFTDGAAAQTIAVDRGGCGTASDGTLTSQADDALFAQLDALA